MFWLILTILYFGLSMYHFYLSRQRIPPFRVTERWVPKGFTLEFKISGEDVDKPVQDFVSDFNAHIDYSNKKTRIQNIATAIGYFGASIAALFSVILTKKRSKYR